jgi:hypothetical protein
VGADVGRRSGPADAETQHATHPGGAPVDEEIDGFSGLGELLASNVRMSLDIAETPSSPDCW